MRRDEYLRDGGDLELGIKRRDGAKGVEIKGLVATSDNRLDTGPFGGPIQIWGKWVSSNLELDQAATVTVEKTRWLRKFDTSALTPVEIPLDGEEQPPVEQSHHHHHVRSCTVELTKVHIADSEVWWTFGFESEGTLRTVEDDLRKVVNVIAERWQSPHLDGLLASYPVWLKEHALESPMAHASL